MKRDEKLVKELGEERRREGVIKRVKKWRKGKQRRKREGCRGERG